MEKRCLFCDAVISGRSDKRFCDHHCRSNFYNGLNRDRTNFIRNINNRLRKNRRILSEINPSGRSTVHINQLVAKGFCFDFYTNTYTSRYGNKYFCCYDHGYRILENNYLLVMKKEEWI